MQKILIIEDDITINGLPHNIVGKNGYQADSAYDGAAGLDKAMHGDYQLILMDLMLPGLPGEDYYSDDNTMNVHISNLRKKIAEHTDQKYIETVYGMGYRLSS